MSAAIARKMKRKMGRLLKHRATVYTRAVSGGTYTTVATTGLKCLLQQVNVRPPATSQERAQMADLRTLYFDPSYTMPESAQIAVDVESGVRWNVVSGTVVPDIVPDIVPGNVVVMQHADVRRAR